MGKSIKSGVVVVAAAGLFAVGGMSSSVAAKLITGDDIKNNSIGAKQIAKNSIGKSELKPNIFNQIKDGADGAQGPAGPAGADGADGAQGPKGEPGDVSGVKGPKGDTGAQGPTGATGPAGAAGPAGTDGTGGVNGRYVTNRTVSVPAGEVVGHTRTCDKNPGDVAISGGATPDNSAAGLVLSVVGSGPDVAAPNAWVNTVRNTGTRATAFRSWAVCAAGPVAPTS